MIFKAVYCLLLNKYYTNDTASLRHKKIIYILSSRLVLNNTTTHQFACEGVDILLKFGQLH
jgi:hypothetical protein